MTRGVLSAAALLLAGFLLPLNAAAQQPQIDARAELDRSDVTLGDRVRITVSVVHPDDILVTVEPPEQSSSVRITDLPPPTTQPGVAEGRSLTQFEFVVAAFRLGTQELPPMRVTWLEEDGTSGMTEVPVPPLNVQSTVAADDTAPRPLKPQLLVEGAPPAWQVPAAAAAGVVLLGALALLAIWGLRRRAPAPVATPVVPMLAEDQARRLLEEMALANPLSARDYDTYYGTISIVIRGYLQARFGFRATALTTHELERRMTAEGVERWQARLVGGLLDRCDSAVYARRWPDPASADHDLTVAFEIIELSRPKPEAAAAEVA
jgi:hypothetical protein